MIIILKGSGWHNSNEIQLNPFTTKAIKSFDKKEGTDCQKLKVTGFILRQKDKKIINQIVTLQNKWL